MAVGDDFKVSRRFREEVSDQAAVWRAADPGGVAANRFDVVRFLTEVVIPALATQGRIVDLKIVDDDPSEPDGWVDVAKGEICFQESVWTLALRQHEHGRLVVAHEIGHLILHGDQVHAFSRGQEKKLGFLDAAESAECQANWFASALLLPDAVMRRLAKLDDDAVAILTLVRKRLVEVRRREVEMDKRYRSYTGDQCGNCNSMQMKVSGLCLMCEDCGALAECR